MRRQVTIKQIAKLAGVNASTVSRVFNPASGYSISSAIREKVIAIADEHEYAPRDAARSLVHGRTFNFGVILHSLEADMFSPYLSLVLASFSREAMLYGYKMVFLPVEDGNFDREVVKYIRGGNADAYLVGGSLIGSETIEELDKKRVPVVVYTADKILSKKFGNVCPFSFDNKPAFESMYSQVKERGFDSFLLFNTERLKICSRTDYQKNSADYGVKMADYIEYEGSLRDLMIRNDTRVFVMKNINRFKQHELIICGNDLMALGICDALRDSGIEPGKDISIIGYDNIEENPNFSTSSKPFLSTVAVNESLIGRMMAKLLRDNLAMKEFKPQSFSVPAKFIARESLGYKKK
ncbi:MAG: LacI family DNA-binding transcriptional regulator [Victivallaceae bacterium]